MSDWQGRGDEEWPGGGRRFDDRRQAGRELGARLAGLAGLAGADVIVLGLPRGGVPVAFEVARALGAPLDVCVVRKLGLPGHEELAMGAVASGGEVVLEPRVVRVHRVSRAVLERVAAVERRELERRELAYRGSRPPPTVEGRTVVLVDDGLATGSTMRAAARSVRASRPARLVVAVPVSPRETLEEIRSEVDDVVCLETPEPFLAVGAWYRDFTPTGDEEVSSLLSAAAPVGGGGDQHG
jgi:putative phosphoribosyl transferase